MSRLHPGCTWLDLVTWLLQPPQPTDLSGISSHSPFKKVGPGTWIFQTVQTFSAEPSSPSNSAVRDGRHGWHVVGFDPGIGTVIFNLPWEVEEHSLPSFCPSEIPENMSLKSVLFPNILKRLVPSCTLHSPRRLRKRLDLHPLGFQQVINSIGFME